MIITTEICKQAIVDWTQSHMQELSVQYGGKRPACDNDLAIGEDDNWEKVWRTKNWSRTSKRKTPEGILREFNCVPFSNQLGAYVYSDPIDAKILTIVVYRKNDQ
jgi:hypothetical protein